LLGGGQVVALHHHQNGTHDIGDDDRFAALDGLADRDQLWLGAILRDLVLEELRRRRIRFLVSSACGQPLSLLAQFGRLLRVHPHGLGQRPVGHALHSVRSVLPAR
jgi:hypothetical protein